MKRYPHGADGAFFFMKRAPEPRPDWIPICSINHGSKGVIPFPIIQDLAALLWVINLGCIDLNPWYARCDETDRPDFLHFDLDPVEGAGFDRVRETALVVRDALAKLDMPSYAKTTGSKGIHVYVPIERGPVQKEVWELAKALAFHPGRTAPRAHHRRVHHRQASPGPRARRLQPERVGRTLASIYSVRPRPRASASAPVTWTELERGVEIDDFRLDNLPERVARLGDLWAPVVAAKDRVSLDRFVGGQEPPPASLTSPIARA